MKQTTMLMILDGFGKSEQTYGNAIRSAHTPNLNALFSSCPHTTIGASGLDVGLPAGQMGNSEVGHLNIGAGRVVYQELTKITKEIEDGGFFHNEALIHAMEYTSQNHSSLHLMGLLSDGGVHSHIRHLFALLDMAKEKNVPHVYVHAILDGRDVAPRCAQIYLDQLERHMEQLGLGQIATISGRYYAMDRDNRWEREQMAYDAMTIGRGFIASSSAEALRQAYNRNENDEFIKPTVITAPDDHITPKLQAEITTAKVPVATVNDGDAIIFFNFRPDRARQITRAFTDNTFTGFTRKKTPTNLCFICMTQYDKEMPNVLVAFPPQSLKNTLGEYLSELGFKQLRIAETEKYAHVTFFFNGGIEAPNNGEDRILIPSPKVATYDLQPEMSAYKVTERVIEQIKNEVYDVIILNFANCDMVGHTGVMDAAVKAVEAVDCCVGDIVNVLRQTGGQLLLTADHGNADCMLDEEGNVVTAHSLNPVPLLVMTDHPVKLKGNGILADLAPTLLDLMNVPKPEEMTGKSLLE